MPNFPVLFLALVSGLPHLPPLLKRDHMSSYLVAFPHLLSAPPFFAFPNHPCRAEDRMRAIKVV